jgi:hypothetical protein
MDDQFRNDDDQLPPEPLAAEAQPPSLGEHVMTLRFAPFAPHPGVAAWQRNMLRRLAALLCTGTVAFTLTTWILVQRERQSPAARTPGTLTRSATDGTGSSVGEEPAQTARAQLEALKRGDARAAYAMFSKHYRDSVTLEAFKALVSSHRKLFRVEEEEIDSLTVSPDRVRIDMHLQSDDDDQYIAHFILTRVDGRWWVDDLRWVNADDEGEDLTSA